MAWKRSSIVRVICFQAICQVCPRDTNINMTVRQWARALSTLLLIARLREQIAEVWRGCYSLKARLECFLGARASDLRTATFATSTLLFHVHLLVAFLLFPSVDLLFRLLEITKGS